MAKRALITGIAAQDGSYLAELLVAKGYEVHGIVHPRSMKDPDRHLARLAVIRKYVNLHPANVDDYANIKAVFRQALFKECYHLAAQSLFSCQDEVATLKTNIAGTHHVLSAIKELAPECRFFFAGSSEMFGRANELPQNEQTPFCPRSCYGISKVCGFELTRLYREAHGIFGCTGMLFNHESPRRGLEFVSRKISAGVAQIVSGHSRELRLGNIEARRDWGHAKDYVEAMWLMLQHGSPSDYVVATGELHTVGEFVALAFSSVGLDWREYVQTDPRLYRPNEACPLLGDPAVARRTLGWRHETTFAELVQEMVEADCRVVGRPNAVARC